MAEGEGYAESGKDQSARLSRELNFGQQVLRRDVDWLTEVVHAKASTSPSSRTLSVPSGTKVTVSSPACGCGPPILRRVGMASVVRERAASSFRTALVYGTM